jgi:DNA ligase (NAD+)
MDNILGAKLEALDSIYEIGEVMASSIKEYFSRSNTKKLIGELRLAGLNFNQAETGIKKAALTGKTVVFTGELNNYSRKSAEDLLRACGGNPVSSVSKHTDFVVAGSNPGSKFEAAKKLGVKIIDENKFKEMLR